MIVSGWHLPDGDEHFIGAAKTGGYEPHLWRALLPHITEFTTAIDAGAHVGFYTAKMVPLFRNVWAFEPAPANYACLIRNVPEAKAIRVALGNEQGKLRMRLPNVKNSGSWEAGEGDLIAPVMRLNDYPIPGPVGLLKIDVQGMEVDVLKGGEAMIRRDKPVIVVEVKLRGETNHDIAVLLREWGAEVLEDLGTDIVMGWP